MSVSFQILTLHTENVRENMTLDSEARRLRAKQVGMLMQAYRRSYSENGEAKRLSQEGLLNLMGEADSKYLDRYDRSTVARWESGEIRPNRERLEVFGLALDLSPIEIDGLISLAGLEPDDADPPDEAQSFVDPANADGAVLVDTIEHPGPEEVATVAGGDDSPSYARHVMRYAFSRFLLPGSCVGLAGYFLASFGWNSSFILAVYVGVIMCLLTAQGFLRLRRSDDLGGLLFVTVFFQLSIPLLHAPLTRMDTYGLYSLGGFAGTSIPFTISLIANLLVATVAGLMFNFLRRWQYSGPAGGKSVYSRAAWVVIPPIAFVYAFVLAFSNVGFWIIGLGLFTLVAGVFITLLVLRDENISVGGWDRKFLLCTAVAVTIVLTAIGLAAILATYMQPSLYAVSEQGLFYSWEVDFDALGYPAEEYFERSRLAVVWASLTTLAYMVIVIGGKLIVTIYRLDGGDSSIAAAAVAQVEDSLPQRTKRRSRVDVRYWAGWIADHRIFQPLRNRTSSLFN